jgi:hypothetical protein
LPIKARIIQNMFREFSQTEKKFAFPNTNSLASATGPRAVN